MWCTKRWFHGLALTAPLFFASVARAEPVEDKKAPPGETKREPSKEVLVLGGARSPGPATSTFAIRVGALALVPRKNATALLSFAPGILLTSEGGDGHAEQIFLRGFDAREGQDLELSVGGVPINESGNLHGNGYADTHFILPSWSPPCA
jgi:iron complex outermembrane receptor protein